MNIFPFDSLIRTVSTVLSRRTLAGALGLSVLGPTSLVDARKKRKRKKKKCAKSGQKTSKNRKKCCKGLVKDATKRCAARRCACPADHICLRDGVCQLCNVTCPSGNPVICGALLQSVLNLGETLYVCPGVYRANFTAEADLTIIGAGENDDPASNTILEGNGAGPVLNITSGTGPIELERLRLTGGSGGISHQGTTLHMTECTVSDNTGAAGIHLFSGTTTLAGSTEVRGNTATRGGGIYINQGTLEIAETCRVTENTAAAMGDGGGIYNSSEFGMITLQGADLSPIVVNNCHENCAGPGGVPKCAATPVSCPP